jgi:hypothetical protein
MYSMYSMRSTQETVTTEALATRAFAAADPWPPLPGRWPLSRAVHDDWLRLDLRRLDDEQRQV